MTTVFPGSIDSYTTKVDGVDDVMATHVNDLQDAVVAIETNLIAKAPNPNLLYHTLSHDIWLDGTTFNDIADDTYVGCLWNCVWGGNAPDISTLVDVSTNRYLKCLFDTNGSQAGFVQFLNNADTVRLRGKTISFSVYAIGFNVTKLRIAILGWGGTADSLTSDVVATWQAGNPVLATNWSYLSESGTPTDRTISGVATRIKAEGTTIPDDTSVNNLAVFVWTPETENATDYFTLELAKLELGLTATTFAAPLFNEELARVQQFLETPLDLDVVTPTTTEHVSLSIWGNTIGNGQQYGQQFFKTRKYKTPTVTVYPYTTVANTNRISNSTGTDQAANSGVAVSITQTQFGIQNNSGGNVTTTNNLILFSWLADGRL